MDADAAVIGAGVVGCAAALALARRGAAVTLLEAEAEPGLAASGTNSGILHTGFDSAPGELETELILRAAALRDPVLDALAIPVVRCGALLRSGGDEERTAVEGLMRTAEANGVAVELDERGSLLVPDEAVTDPAAYTLALCSAAQAHGAQLRTRFEVAATKREAEGWRLTSPGGESIRARVIVNCAGLRADEVAGRAGDAGFEIYPRKGEFLVFDPPDGEPLERILLPVPSKRTKGVLVFPTVDGKVIAGPTAVDGEDKGDWSVRDEAAGEILPKACAIHPPLEGAEPIAAYAGLRPAGRGVNYVVAASRAAPGLVNAAAIRSTGLTASLGIGERVAEIVAELGTGLAEAAPLRAGTAPPGDRGPWWRRSAEYRAAA